MRKIITAACSLALLLFFASAMQSDEALTRSGGNIIVQTATIGKKYRGYKSYTPVRITISGNKVVHVEALPNKEDPKYFDRAQKVLKQYEGLPVNKALKLKVDAVTGATYSSESLIGNVKAGLDYYKKHK